MSYPTPPADGAAPRADQQQPGPAPQKSGSKTGIIVALLAVLTLVLGAGAFYLLGPASNHNNSAEKAVPSVVGFNVDQATKEIEGAGFVVADVTAKPSDVADGTVLAQDPKAGTSLPSGSAVNLVVAGPANPQVPSVVQSLQADAEKVLAAAGFTLGEVTLTPNSAPAGTVLAQDPKAGTSAKKGSAVNLTVSNGKVTVPNVLGLTEVRATAKLQDAGFVVQTQAGAPGSGKPGTVVRTNPAADRVAVVGTTVVITVAPAAPAPTASR